MQWPLCKNGWLEKPNLASLHFATDTCSNGAPRSETPMKTAGWSIQCAADTFAIDDCSKVVTCSRYSCGDGWSNAQRVHGPTVTVAMSHMQWYSWGNDWLERSSPASWPPKPDFYYASSRNMDKISRPAGIYSFTFCFTIRAIRQENPCKSSQRYRQGLKPNVITYSSLVSACSKGMETEKALEVCANLKHSGLQPDVITLNALISACSKKNEKEKALEVFVDMKQSGLKPNVITYHAVVSACAKGEQTDNAKRSATKCDHVQCSHHACSKGNRTEGPGSLRGHEAERQPKVIT